MSALIRQFVPQDLDPSQWFELEPWYRALHERSFGSVADTEQWLRDFSELSAVVSEYGSRRSIDKACHTDDAEIAKAFLHYVENIAPRVKPWYFKLQQKLVNSPHVDELDAATYGVLLREWRSDVDLFRDQNVPLQTRVTKLNSEYDKFIGAMTVEHDGKTYTLQQLAKFQEATDRSVRESTWRASTERRLEDRDAIEDIFDQVLDLRQQIAENAGKDNFRGWTWQSFGRFDYTPEDCLAFGEAIERVVVPRVRALDEARRESLGVETLRPWDIAVDVAGREPLQPFDGDHAGELVDKCRAVFARLSPDLAEDFARLKFGRNLDLESRLGKRAGGFQSSLAESGEPFIFMNAAGLHRDVETLLHEGGHAFHFMWSLGQPLMFMRHAPIEFCEVASMGMELMSVNELDVFYDDPSDLARAQRKFYEGIIRFFPWMAIIDGFQHWLYTHPGHTRDERQVAWLKLMDRFGSGVVDWSGLDDARAARWQQQLHLFHYPFYYVEYGIAQLGALQMWQRFNENREQTLSDYRYALSLGNSRPLPDLFAAGNIRFDFTQVTLEPLIAALDEELLALPA